MAEIPIVRGSVRRGKRRAWSRYRSPDGKDDLLVKISVQEYDDLGLPGAGPPKVPEGFEGWTWISSAAGDAFSTPDDHPVIGEHYVYDNKNLLMLPTGLLSLKHSVEKGKISGEAEGLTISDEVIHKGRRFQVVNGKIIEVLNRARL